MPYKYDRLGLKIPKELKKTAKYSDTDRLHVQKMYMEGISIHQIANITGISRRMVQFIIFPERLVHAKELQKQRRKDGRYYNRIKHTKAIREHRKYKYSLYLEGKL